MKAIEKGAKIGAKGYKGSLVLFTLHTLCTNESPGETFTTLYFFIC